MIPRRVRFATLLSFVLHGALILTGRYRLSYDAYNHIFFGDHYRLDWWSLWEPRWYTGFQIVSYPPLTHQLIGLAGRLIGVEPAFALLLWAVLTCFPLAVYAFCRVFCGRGVAGQAALAAAVLPSVYQAAHTFGQLPTLTSGVFALFGLAALNQYLRRGDRLSGALAVALFGALMAAHHATLLFLPWGVLALLLHLVLNGNPDWKRLPGRFTLVACLAGLAGLVVIWPFWAWGAGQAMQTPIDHPSRHNFFLDLFAPLAFFLPVYGPLIPLIPVVLWKGWRKRSLGLWLAFLMLFLLGLGGTTPLPRLLFGVGWEWLTYDRFALWASWFLLPFFGWAMVVLRRRRSVERRRSLSVTVYGLLGLSAIICGLLPTLLPTQPAPVDLKPLAAFLAQDDRAKWRYVTFGFGDQFAALSLMTSATTIDGSYHTARTLPELRNSGVGQIDTSYWLPDGLSRLDPILQKSGERGVRWGFVNRPDYLPILRRNGWMPLTTLENGVQVWENPRASLPAPTSAPPESPLAQFSWGVFPLLALCITLALALLRLSPSAGQRFLYGLHHLAIGLLPVSLCLWYYRTVWVNDHARVYFTYANGLVYGADALAGVACLAWWLGRVFGPRQAGRTQPAAFLLQPQTWFGGLCAWASLSLIWSQDRPATLFAALHLWLAFWLFISLRERPAARWPFAYGASAALTLQALIALREFWEQSSLFLRPLGLNWPGELTSASAAASVVQLADGARWLRVYGSLPHPNILGGLLVVFLAGLAVLYLDRAGGRHWLLALAATGGAVLALTFSRSAWLGFALLVVILLLRAQIFPRRRLLLFLGAVALGVSLVVLPLRELFFVRSGGAAVKTEEFSMQARWWLSQQALVFLGEHPASGLGYGAFVIALAQRAAQGYIIEPVHNLFLLAGSELGLPGLVMVLGLAVTILRNSLQTRQALAVIFSAALAGLFAISMFDHYLWTLPAGQVLFGLMLGLWAGQTKAPVEGAG